MSVSMSSNDASWPLLSNGVANPKPGESSRISLDNFRLTPVDDSRRAFSNSAIFSFSRTCSCWESASASDVASTSARSVLFRSSRSSTTWSVFNLVSLSAIVVSANSSNTFVTLTRTSSCNVKRWVMLSKVGLACDTVLSDSSRLSRYAAFSSSIIALRFD